MDEISEESKNLVVGLSILSVCSLISLGCGMYYHYKKTNELESKVNLLELELSGVKGIQEAKRDYSLLRIRHDIEPERMKVLEKHEYKNGFRRKSLQNRNPNLDDLNLNDYSKNRNRFTVKDSRI